MRRLLPQLFVHKTVIRWLKKKGEPWKAPRVGFNVWSGQSGVLMGIFHVPNLVSRIGIVSYVVLRQEVNAGSGQEGTGSTGKAKRLDTAHIRSVSRNRNVTDVTSFSDPNRYHLGISKPKEWYPHVSSGATKITQRRPASDQFSTIRDPLEDIHPCSY
ncbi:hypothetical protein WG66_012892 [Moniliophthora roreri]|nr:hypothetical protein WG66_012892 [Moniliophthora roreri]